jgi:prepilin-type N-terminal cleavage/methylation domain-containing protein/prepilin-type processing-associated H-X9-DG protein
VTFSLKERKLAIENSISIYLQSCQERIRKLKFCKFFTRLYVSAQKMNSKVNILRHFECSDSRPGLNNTKEGGNCQKNRNMIDSTVIAGGNRLESDIKSRFAGKPPERADGFTLVELLTVIAVIAVLAALLLPALSKAREDAQSASCKNLLKQIGLGLKMYASDYGWYPPLAERGDPSVCFDRLFPYYPVHWTNASWNCPVYIAHNGILSREMVATNSIGISYSYNWLGIGAGGRGTTPLGLGHLPKNSAKELAIAAPSEMYAVADARCEVGQGFAGMAGCIKMSPYQLDNETPPPHGNGLNTLFVDGHVAWVKRNDFLYPPRTACHWNRDNQPHPEQWASMSQWVITN